MKILMLRNAAASFGCKLTEGETGDVDKSLAEALIARGIAVSAEIKAVPEKPNVKPSTKPTTAE
jgi:hypothetical protein